MSRIEGMPEIELKHILIATDLSAASLWSVPYAISIARLFGSTVYVGHVIPLETYAVARPQSFDAIEKECREHASEKLNNIAAELTVQGVHAQTLLTEGDVGVMLPEWVREYDIRLVAVGTTGRTGIRKLALGSTAEEIIRAADCPVLTVGPGLTKESPVTLRSVLYATDFSPDSVRAGTYALSIARRYRARLIVLHVTQNKGTQQSRQQLAKKLEKLISMGKSSTQPEILIAAGKPTERILEIAKEHLVDLVVIGTRGTDLARAASHFGSTAHDIVVHASCPVLTARVSQQAL